tara:strand:+ start:1230 stop:1883 length:654 start_codon:yes stop_codon:yes gene_type:complete
MKVDILVPSSLSEITLEQYQKFERINTKENQDTNFLMHKMVEVFCNLDLKDVAKIRFNYVKSILNDLNGLFNTEDELIPTFTLNGVEYGFIPALDDMTLGEYIDLDENFSSWETMHKAMAVLYRPITLKSKDKYHIEDYKGLELSVEMKRMPLDVVMSAMVFFYRLNNELLQTTLNYLSQEFPKQMTMEQRQTLAENGVGIKASMESLRGMLRSMTI